MLKAPSPASLVAAATLTSLAPAQAATDAAAGKKVFDLKCATCHATVAGKTISWSESARGRRPQSRLS